MKFVRTVLLIPLLAAAVFAQQSADQPSLGDVARASKAKSGTKAKTVITDETIRSSKSPFPDINGENDNSDEIVKAILQFSTSKVPKETEDAVHTWYDYQDGVIAGMIDDAKKTRRNALDRYQYPSDVKNPASYNAQRERDTMSDYRRYSETTTSIRRMLDTLTRVKAGLKRSNLAYDWMKIRDWAPYGDE